MACMLDFRNLDEGLGGEVGKKKRKREADEAAAAAAMDIVDDDSHSAKRVAMAKEGENKPSSAYGKPSYDGTIAGKVSGRKWKQPKQTRASALRVTKRPPTFEERNRDKQIKKAYKERMTELKEQIRNNKIEKRKIKEEREKRKQENILKSGLKLQKITNPKTLKRISKSKQKKLLKVVPDELLAKKK